jgi:hypothetical protein
MSSAISCGLVEIPGATLLVLDGVGAELPSRAYEQVATAVLAHTAQ